MNEKQLERQQIKAELGALAELSTSISSNADNFRHADALDKIRRYGRRGYSIKYLGILAVI